MLPILQLKLLVTNIQELQNHSVDSHQTEWRIGVKCGNQMIVLRQNQQDEFSRSLGPYFDPGHCNHCFFTHRQYQKNITCREDILTFLPLEDAQSPFLGVLPASRYISREPCFHSCTCSMSLNSETKVVLYYLCNVCCKDLKFHF